jgi:hypothetical protein
MKDVHELKFTVFLLLYLYIYIYIRQMTICMSLIHFDVETGLYFIETIILLLSKSQPMYVSNG